MDITNAVDKLENIRISLDVRAGILDGLLAKIKKLKDIDPNKAASFLLSLSGWVDKLTSKKASVDKVAAMPKSTRLILSLMLSIIPFVMNKVTDPGVKSQLQKLEYKVKQTHTVIQHGNFDEKEFDNFMNDKSNVMDKLRDNFGEKHNYSSDETSIAEALAQGKTLEQAKHELRMKKKILEDMH